MSGAADDTASRYLALARDYESAAVILAAAGGERQSPAAFSHLVAHAFELGLKAAVAAGTNDAEALIALGHDIAFCLQVAERKGLMLGAEDITIRAGIEAMSADHHAQSYRYPTRLRWIPADPTSALPALRAVLDVVSVALAPTSRQAPSPS